MLNKKKSFFKQKIEEVNKVVWDLEFKIHKAHQMREQSRQQRDQNINALMRVDESLKADPTNENLLKEKANFEVIVGKLEGQMKMIDDQINGVPATEEDSGAQGIMEMIGGYAELREMYKTYISEL